MTACTDNIIDIKIGSTAKFAVLYADAAGNPVSLVGYDIAMDFVDKKTGEYILQATLGEEIILDPYTIGGYNIEAGDTSEWPVGIMPVDIKYTDPQGITHYTEDFGLNMILGRTL